MDGIDKITARIEADAAADAAHTAELAQGQCDSIRADGEKQAQDYYWQKIREGNKLAEDRASQLVTAADMEARKQMLAYKQSLVAEVFDKAEEKILNMSGETYVDFLAGQAARASVTGMEKIILSGKDRAELGSKIVSRANVRLAGLGKTGRLILADETGDFRGGLILQDGKIEVNCTLETLMAQARVAMASLVASELFN